MMALPVLVLVALLVGIPLWIVRASRRGRQEDEESTGGLRRFLHYGSLFALLVAAASGLKNLLVSALAADRLSGGGASELALGLSLTVVAVPAWVLVWRGVRGRLLRDPQERGSVAWVLYLAAASTTSLVVALANAAQAAAWALGVVDIDHRAVASAVAWGAAWGVHARLARHPTVSPTNKSAGLVALAGSAVGLVALALGIGGMVAAAAGEAYRAVAATSLVERPPAEGVRQSLALAALAAPVWWWHWLRQAVHGPRDTMWHAYVMLLPVAGGSLAAVGAGAVALNLVLQWFLGVPDAERASTHFESLPLALSVALVAAWAWWYHRRVLAAAEAQARTEPERAYEYLVAGVGLVAAASGVTVGITALIQTLAPAPLAAAGPGGRNTLVSAITLLVAGGPLWWVFWRRVQEHVGADGATEAGSPSRRTYLLLLFGATGVAATISLVILLYVVFRDAIEGALSAGALYDLRAAVALVLTAGVVSAYHWRIHLRDRALQPPAGTPALRRSVLLVSPDGRFLAGELAARTGATVRVLQRKDVAPATVDPGPVAAAVLASTHERLLVVVDEHGDVRVIPYESA